MRNKVSFGLLTMAVLMACTSLRAQQIPKAPKSAQAKPPATHKRVSNTQRVEAAIEKKDWATAESLLNDAVKDDPKNYQALFYLGYVYNATGRSAEAIEAYRKAVAVQPGVIEVNLNLGILLAQKGSPEAAKYLRLAMQEKPTPEQKQVLASAWTHLAEALAESDYATSADCYERAAELLPKESSIRVELGRLHEKHKDMAGAEREYKKALAVDPKSANALALLSNFYMRTRKLPEAESTLREFLQLHPDNVAAHVQLGRVLAAQNKDEAAAAELKIALDADPNDLDALRVLAETQLTSKQYVVAEASYRRLVAAFPKDAEAHFGLGTSLMRQAKYPEAKTELLAAVKIKGDLAEAYSDLALAAENDKDYNLALRALDARAKFLPDTPGTIWIRATTLDHLGAMKEASEQYKKFLAVDEGKFPDQEFQARHRLIAIDPESRAKNEKKK